MKTILKKTYTILLIIISLTSCKKAPEEINNLQNGKIYIIGHGGMGIYSLYHINSYQSATKCLENEKADGIELDIQLSADNKLIAFHDSLLENSTKSSGMVRAHTSEKLLGVKYKGIYTTANTLALVDNLFENNRYNNKIFIMDCKLYPLPEENSDRYINDFADAINRFSVKFPTSNIIVESHVANFLIKIKELNPGIKVYLNEDNIDTAIKKAIEYQFDGVTCNLSQTTAKHINIAHTSFIKVSLWNIKSRNQSVKAAELNPEIIQTDRISAAYNAIY